MSLVFYKKKDLNCKTWQFFCLGCANGKCAFLYIDNEIKNVNVFDNPIENVDRSELLSVINAIEWIKPVFNPVKHKIIVFTSSNYVNSLLTSWMNNWKLKDFKTPVGNDRPNSDLLRRLYKHSQEFNITVRLQPNNPQINELKKKIHTIQL